MLTLSHKKLDVYVISLQLVKEVYKITKAFPKEEQYILVSQLRRAVISVCSNIAEGAARKSKRGKQRFYEIARSSAVEIDTQLEVSISLGYVEKDQLKDITQQLESVFKMLSKLIASMDAQAPLATSE